MEELITKIEKRLNRNIEIDEENQELLICSNDKDKKIYDLFKIIDRFEMNINHLSDEEENKLEEIKKELTSLTICETWNDYYVDFQSSFWDDDYEELHDKFFGKFIEDAKDGECYSIESESWSNYNFCDECREYMSKRELNYCFRK